MTLTLDELLAQNDPSKIEELSKDELHRLFWRFKGQSKGWDRDKAFWQATNKNLKVAN